MSKTQSFQKLPPAWFVKAINSFRTFLTLLNRSTFPGNVVLYEQFQYFWLLPSLYVAAKLDIATLLKTKALTAIEISGQLALDPDNVSRLLRALSSHGIFKLTHDGRYALNAMARSLLDEPGSLRHVVLHHLGPVNWNMMSNLEYTVRTGKDAFSDKYGQPVYEYLKDHPQEYALFDKSMSDLSSLGLAPILNAYDFSGFKLITDIGGGEGFLLANILKFNPGSEGVLFDTEQALEKAGAMFMSHKVEDRVKIVAGNFFNTVPGSGDLFILKNIIHNWSDDEAIEILKRISMAISPQARLLIIEMVVPADGSPSMSKLLDIQMMATMTGGRERTAGEYHELLAKSGFTQTRIIPTISPISLIEARKSG